MRVSWSAPSETGGRSDLYYVVEYSDPDNAGRRIGTTCKSSTSHTFTGLRAFTQYCFQVSAHNGVSDQDPDNAALRTVEQCMQTPEASKILLIWNIVLFIFVLIHPLFDSMEI